MRRSSVIIVVVIIVAWGGLFVGFVQTTQRAAAKTQCINNLKQLSMSMHTYHDSFKKLPTATTSDNWNRRDLAPMAPVEQRLSWFFEISPYVEARMDLKWSPDNSKPWDAPENQHVANGAMPYLQCSAHPGRGEPHLITHYVGNAGVGKDAIRLPKEYKNAGMLGYDRRLTFADINDGTSCTLAISETARDNDRWAKPGHASVRGLDPDGGPYLGASGQFNSHHYEGLWDKRYFTNVALADASVKTLSDKVSPRVFEALATIAGGEKFEPGDW